MIPESIAIITIALVLDLTLGDPKNRYHPTAWIGKFIGKLVVVFKTGSAQSEKLGGIIIVLTVSSLVAGLLLLLYSGLNLISIESISIILSIVIGAVLLKTTIAIKGMEIHAMKVIESVQQDNIESARNNLSMIVKRKTDNLDKNHVISGVLESISENTVDGITGPLFYYGIFGLPGAFVYRIVNTIDSMIGYKTEMFSNLGWFGANCDNILNFIPSRLTGLMMVFATMILGKNWKSAYGIMMRDGRKTSSPNAGYPMAALAGALGVSFEKVDYYKVGDGPISYTNEHVKTSIKLMKITSILFCGMITIPLATILSNMGWWIHA